MNNVSNFQIAKSSASGYFLAFALFFSKFQPGVAYKSVAYKKACISRSKGSLKFDQLIEWNTRIIFLEKSYTRLAENLFTDPILKNQN